MLQTPGNFLSRIERLKILRTIAPTLDFAVSLNNQLTLLRFVSHRWYMRPTSTPRNLPQTARLWILNRRRIVSASYR